MDIARRPAILTTLRLTILAASLLLLGGPICASAACDPNTTCSGHGTCNLDDTCNCNPGFVGASCDLCAPNYYNYPSCTFCQASTTCSGNGTCSATGSCNCNTGFSGVNCEIPPPTTSTTTTSTTTTIAASTTTTSTLPPPSIGFIPPDNDARVCTDSVTRALGKLAKAITGCHVKAADSAFHGRSFDEDGCKAAAKGKFDAAVAKVAAKVQCPPCVLGNAPGLRDDVESFLDQKNGQAYCAGTVPLP